MSAATIVEDYETTRGNGGPITFKRILIIEGQPMRYRVTIHEDGYAFQSYEKIEQWFGGAGWKEVYTRNGRTVLHQQYNREQNAPAIEVTVTELVKAALLTDGHDPRLATHPYNPKGWDGA